MPPLKRRFPSLARDAEYAVGVKRVRGDYKIFGLRAGNHMSRPPRRTRQFSTANSLWGPSSSVQTLLAIPAISVLVTGSMAGGAAHADNTVVIKAHDLRKLV